MEITPVSTPATPKTLTLAKEDLGPIPTTGTNGGTEAPCSVTVPILSDVGCKVDKLG